MTRWWPGSECRRVGYGRLRHWAVAALALVGATAVVAPSAHAQVQSLVVVAQTFNVSSTGAVAITVRVPSGLATEPAGLSFGITAYRPLVSRAAVADAIAGDLTRNIDAVELTSDNILRPATDELQVVVPVEVTTRTSGALQLSKAGLYPLLLELRRDGETVAEVVSFVHRVPADNEGDEDELLIAVAVAATSRVVLDDRARVAVDAPTLANLTALAELLELSAVPVSVRLEPSIIEAVADTDDRELVQRLDAALDRHDLESATSFPLDPSAASEATQGALYTQWLRDGEDALARALATNPVRTVSLTSQPLSRDGAALLRELGVRLLVLSPAEFASLDVPDADRIDTTQRVQLAITEGVTIDAMVADTTVTTTLKRHTDEPVLAAIYAVSDLFALRNEIARSGGDPRRHGVVIATPDFGVPSAAFGAFSSLLDATPGLRPATLDDLSVRTDELLDDEGPVVVDLPESVPGDIAARVATAGAIKLQSISASSMLPAGDARPTEWNRLAGLLPTSALTDAKVDTVATFIRSEQAQVLGSIEVPNGFSFNLTGRTGTVRVSLKNTNTIPLKVRVRLSSPKLVAPSRDQVVELAPGAFTEVKIDIRARSNGRFPAALELFTPSGDVRLAAPVPITASITALSGLGNLVTGAALLVLLSWWLRNLRKNRRARIAAEASHHHPATQATTLPDS